MDLADEGIGSTGVWTRMDGFSTGEAIEFAQRVEELGYGALWIPDAFGRDPVEAFDHLELGTVEQHVALDRGMRPGFEAARGLVGRRGDGRGLGHHGHRPVARRAVAVAQLERQLVIRSVVR